VSSIILKNNKLIQFKNFFIDKWNLFKQKSRSGQDDGEEKMPQLDGYSLGRLYHYASLHTLFDMLEGDSLWVSGLRFSNDYSEEKLLGEDWLEDRSYNGDNFIFCTGETGDLLSQWRGYCMNGGAAIGFDIEKQAVYGVLHADFDKLQKHENIEAIPFPVLYTHEQSAEDARGGAQLIARIIEDELRNDKASAAPKYPALEVTDFVPYIKHFAFHEERERRLLFSNSNGELSKCIRFRILPNGTKIPYIVVKREYVRDSRQKKENTSKTNIKKIIENRERSEAVVVPVCSNQNEISSLLRDYIRVNDLKKEFGEIGVFCEGHLPIRSITIAPMPDQNRIKEQVSRFCQSKHWLKDVKIQQSYIPYVLSINSQR
jgi:hypothetical protein